MKKDRVNNRKPNEIGVSPFPPLPVQIHPFPPPRSTNRASLTIGIMAGVGLIALLAFAVPWDLASQTLTGSFGSLYTQAKQVKFAQVKQSKEVSSPPEISAPTTSAVETTLTSEASAPAAPAIETGQAVPISEPDPRFLVSRYPARKYTEIRHKISKGETLYSFIRGYGNRIFPKKYRNWKLLAQYNNIRPPHYVLVPGADFLIPTSEYIVLPKTGYKTELKEIQSEIAKQPNNPELLNQRAIIHFKRNELSQARSTLRQGIRSSPKSGILHNNLGFIYLIIEDDKRAQSEFELAITHSEKPAIPYCNLGTLYMTMDKFDLAIKTFESALEADANLLDAKYNLALAHEKVGNVDSARKHLRELAQLLSDDTEVTSALERLTSP